jgi:serine/threonine protein kinase
MAASRKMFARMNALQTLGKYRLDGLLASGGMGEIYRASNLGPEGFNKTVVVKRILPHLARSHEFVQLFLNEARVAAVLSHPNIVQIYELGHAGEEYFLVMEYVKGATLAALRKRARANNQLLAPEVVAAVCSEVLRALDYAHNACDERGSPLRIIHRDVSPDNVLVSSAGQVKVIDFGIVKATNAVSHTRTGATRGKLSYLAPELIRRMPADHRIDVYATGVMLYELLCGQRPFVGENEGILLHAILQDLVVPPHAHRPEVSRELSAIALKALARNPDDRYATAREMAKALDDALTAMGKTVRSPDLAELVRTLYSEEELSRAGTPVPDLGRVAISPEQPLDQTVVLDDTKETPRSPRRKRLMLGAVAAAAVLSVAAVAFGLGRAGAPSSAGSPGRTEDGAATGAARPARGEASSPPIATPPPQLVPPPVEPAASVLARADSSTDPVPLPTPPKAAPVLARNDGAVENAATTRAAPPRNRPTHGRVVVRAKPWAEVFVAGRKIGMTPLEPFRLKAGNNIVVLKNSEIGIVKSFVVNVPAGGEVVLKADLLDRGG